MLEYGYIKLYRSLLSWEWYDDANTLRLFLHLLLTVNHEPQQWHGMIIERGQRVASYAVLAQELKLSEKAVRTAMKHLKQTGEVAHQSTTKYGLFTVLNYDKFQQQADQEADDRQTEVTAEVTQTAPEGIPEGQQCKKEKKDIYTHSLRARAREPSIDEVMHYAADQKMTCNPNAFFNYYAARGWHNKDGSPVVDWQASLRVWEQREAQFAAHRSCGKQGDARDPKATGPGSSLDKAALDAFIDGQFG